jgi:hypothetical protein
MTLREITMQDVSEVLRRWQVGQIARDMGLDRKTVGRYVKGAKTIRVAADTRALTEEVKHGRFARRCRRVRCRPPSQQWGGARAAPRANQSLAGRLSASGLCAWCACTSYSRATEVGSAAPRSVGTCSASSASARSRRRCSSTIWRLAAGRDRVRSDGFDPRR